MKELKYFMVITIMILGASCNPDSKPEIKSKFLTTNKPGMEHLISKSVKQIANNQVCMVNDKFMNADQIPVQIGDKIYYGCCAGCVANLRTDTTYRLATDPMTGERVDKANAIIIIMPNSKEQVIYFKSENNARTYIESQNKRQHI